MTRTLSQGTLDLLESNLGRYTDLLKYYKSKYKRIRSRKIVLDIVCFTITSSGVVGSITLVPLVALVSAGGVILNKIFEQLKYNKKLIILKKILKELSLIIDELNGYLRGNPYNVEKLLERLNYIDGFISHSDLDL